MFFTKWILVTARGMYNRSFFCFPHLLIWVMFSWNIDCSRPELKRNKSLYVYWYPLLKSSKTSYYRYFFLGLLVCMPGCSCIAAKCFVPRFHPKSHMVQSVVSKVSRRLSWWSSYRVDDETVITNETFTFTCVVSFSCLGR